MVGTVTVRTEVPLFASLVDVPLPARVARQVAAIVTVPGLIPLARPVELMIATLEFEDAHDSDPPVTTLSFAS